MANNVELKLGNPAFTRDRVIRMAGNSIAVNVLVHVFRQFLDLNHLLYPKLKHGRRKKGTSTDVHDPETRSYNMSQIKSKDTKPEAIVSRYLFNEGFRRYQRNDRELPGSPDFVFKKYRTVVFVNGCFWHGHGCKYFRWPQNNSEFWVNKIHTVADHRPCTKPACHVSLSGLRRFRWYAVRQTHMGDETWQHIISDTKYH